eukprot:TRINITY_DN20932_c0_g1_i1.p1 TRINITY_DN20932_c0_g1~~TRINITY_DN20932_c0_g1_i1.p1  ORF type:complete len:459 (-),score=69.04 TRINITY_DN20932_c0_g1_i1:42-1418(-)
MPIPGLHLQAALSAAPSPRAPVSARATASAVGAAGTRIVDSRRETARNGSGSATARSALSAGRLETRPLSTRAAVSATARGASGFGGSETCPLDASATARGALRPGRSCPPSACADASATAGCAQGSGRFGETCPLSSCADASAMGAEVAWARSRQGESDTFGACGSSARGARDACTTGCTELEAKPGNETCRTTACASSSSFSRARQSSGLEEPSHRSGGTGWQPSLPASGRAFAASQRIADAAAVTGSGRSAGGPAPSRSEGEGEQRRLSAAMAQQSNAPTNRSDSVPPETQRAVSIGAKQRHCGARRRLRMMARRAVMQSSLDAIRSEFDVTSSDVAGAAPDVPGDVSVGVPRPPTVPTQPIWVRDAAAEDLCRRRVKKDQVAHLLLRAPDDSSSPMLRDMEPACKADDYISVTRAVHAQLPVEPPSKRWNRPRDRLTVFMEAQIAVKSVGYRGL